jgi:two-component system chemotaxis response regulator CheY
MKILVVEDDFASRKLLITLLSKYGECDMACNGVEGVEAWLSALESGEKYDLITLDIMMPEMNGHEVLKRIRTVELDRQLDPVCIMMTSALSDSENILRAFKNQCEAYLRKPISKSELTLKLVELGLIPATADV